VLLPGIQSPPLREISMFKVYVSAFAGFLAMAATAAAYAVHI
jgi:hypothetical protein